MDSGFSETDACEHLHNCYKCGHNWTCVDETCEADGLSRVVFSSLDDPICAGEEFDPA